LGLSAIFHRWCSRIFAVRRVVEHMATKSEIGEVQDKIADVKKTMVTKDDLREELASVRAELKSIRRELDDLAEKFENVSDFRKEIDHVLERVAEIERHLGNDKKIAA
jgi:flagellar motility protein MotE (MotC chaperone)